MHGVLNTDNMSILGDMTIDYGPYCFVDVTEDQADGNGSDKGNR